MQARLALKMLPHLYGGKIWTTDWLRGLLRLFAPINQLERGGRQITVNLHCANWHSPSPPPSTCTICIIYSIKRDMRVINRCANCVGFLLHIYCTVTVRLHLRISLFFLLQCPLALLALLRSISKLRLLSMRPSETELTRMAHWERAAERRSPLRVTLSFK